jgi:hypothetical protein
LFVKAHQVVVVKVGALAATVDGLVIVEIEQEVVAIIRVSGIETSSRRSPSHGGGYLSVRLSIRKRRLPAYGFDRATLRDERLGWIIEGSLVLQSR